MFVRACFETQERIYNKQKLLQVNSLSALQPVTQGELTYWSLSFRTWGCAPHSGTDLLHVHDTTSNRFHYRFWQTRYTRDTFRSSDHLNVCIDVHTVPTRGWLDGHQQTKSKDQNAPSCGHALIPLLPRKLLPINLSEFIDNAHIRALGPPDFRTSSRALRMLHRISAHEPAIYIRAQD